MHLFYTPDIEGDSYQLDEQESRHAVRVLRLQKGEMVVLVDGKGQWIEARVKDPVAKACNLEILRRSILPPAMPYRLHIAMSPLKNTERFEWFLEKGAELGVSEITPLICHRSERRTIKKERLERILVSAMKQSMGAHLPRLGDPCSFEDFIVLSADACRAIAHCLPAQRVSLKDLGGQRAYTILVGPEGDFTEAEIGLAMEAGYQALHLGESRLRTETAGVHVCSSLRALYA